MAYDNSAIGVADEDDIAQLFPNHEIGDIVYMGVEADLAAQKMGAVSQTRQCWREHTVCSSRQQTSHTSPTPAPLPRTVDQDVIAHSKPHDVISIISVHMGRCFGRMKD
jgi:hypothetical protein